MLTLLEHMYYELGLVTEFNINPATLKKWLVNLLIHTAELRIRYLYDDEIWFRWKSIIYYITTSQLCIQENYRNNPFHNFRHCFCVTQMMYGMIHLCRLNEKMSPEDLGILITSCVCHDLDHPGYNNTYVSVHAKRSRTRYAHSSSIYIQFTNNFVSATKSTREQNSLFGTTIYRHLKTTTAQLPFRSSAIQTPIFLVILTRQCSSVFAPWVYTVKEYWE